MAAGGTGGTGGMALGPLDRATDERRPGRPARDRPVAFSGVAAPDPRILRQLGAAPEPVAVAGAQCTWRDELIGVGGAGETPPDRAGSGHVEADDGDGTGAAGRGGALHSAT